MAIDVSIVLTLHKEGDLIIPTVTAIAEQAKCAARVGLTVELIFVLDRIDATTEKALTALDCSAFANTQYLTVDYGSAALSRASGMHAAQGDYLLIQDGDDFMAYNAITAFHAMALVSGTRTILYPQWVIGFGERDFVTYYENAAHVKGLMIDTHPFVATCFFHSSAIESLVHKQPCSERGEAFEDWLFNAEAMAKGYTLEYCPDTILFYRQHHGSAMDVIRESGQTFELPHNELFVPEVYLKRFQANFEGASDSDNRHHENESPKRFPDTARLTGLIRGAEKIESMINLNKILTLKAGGYTRKSQHAGRKYYKIAQLIHRRSFDCVLLLPSSIKQENIAAILLKMRSFVGQTAPILVITDGSGSQCCISDYLSVHDTLITLPGKDEPLTRAEADHLAFRTILAVAPCSPIFAIEGEISDRILEKYKRQLSHRRITYVPKE